MTNDTATVDVYIREPNYRKTLPSSISTANMIVDFKNRHRRFFKDTTNILWIDSSHFKVFIRPQTTIDFENIAGYFLNSHPLSDIQIFVTSKNIIDTLMNGRTDFRQDKFKYKQNGFIPPRPLLYHDIEN